MNRYTIAITLWALCLSPSRGTQISPEAKSHFPRLPALPGDDPVHYLISENITEFEQNLLRQDTLGPKLTIYDSLLSYGTEDVIDLDEDGAVMQSQDLFEGDILGVALSTLNVHEGDSVHDVKNAIINTWQLWPSGEIPYAVSNKFSQRDRSTIYAAIKEFNEASQCVYWRARESQDHDYVHFIKDDGCFSRVGRVGGAQVLSLGRGCVHLGTVVHEMLHAAGFWHEQSRPDRDDFVTIAWQNIARGREDNFAKYSRAETSTLGLPYDTNSVMHYASTAFSRNGQATIISKANKQTSLGRRDGFSGLDIVKLNTLYGCLSQDESREVVKIPDPACEDSYKNGLCYQWLTKEGCAKYESFMRDYCPKTCESCPLIIVPKVPKEKLPCYDLNPNCPDWASEGMCQVEAEFMHNSCKESCNICVREENEANSATRCSARLAQTVCLLFPILRTIIQQTAS